MCVKQHSMPEMYKWIHKYGGVVQSLVAAVGTPWLEASLGVLAAHHSCAGSTSRLTEIILADIPSASMTFLAQFSSITTMTLDSNHSTTAHSLRTELDLSDLQNLPHLVMLSLQDGKFEELNAAQHLTQLDVSRCQATCSADCRFVATIKELRIWQSGLERVHTNGIAACSNLEVLQMNIGYVSGVGPEASMAFCVNQEYDIPASLSDLTALTCLQLCHSHPSEDVHFGWLADLTSLQTLWIRVTVHTLELPASISALSHLRMLGVVNGAADGQSKLLFAFTGFAYLQKLTLRGSVQCGQSLAQLASLSALTHIELSGMHSVDVDTTAQVGLLAHKLGVTKPDVVFRLK